MKLNRNKYDFLLVGAGLFNAIFAREATKKGKKCLVVEKRPYLGGNLYCELIEDINIHKHGAHIFHTNNREIWNYMSELCEFNHYINSPLARYKNELYNLPFNMNTFYRLWHTITPQEVQKKLEEQQVKISNPKNLEEKILTLVGKDIYEKLVKGYTEKQWGRDATQLPSFIIERIPIRFTYNNNYFEDRYQGIPIGGYNHIFNICFKDCDILLNTDFIEDRKLAEKADKVIYTGMIDQYYNYCFGQLEYRSLFFEKEVLNMYDFQGNAVVNYTERKIPFTRIIEHKHFEFGSQKKTVITREYPQDWDHSKEPYYPINTVNNNLIYEKYKNLALEESNIFFAGRLGNYKYYNMDQIVDLAIKLFSNIEGTFF